MDKSYEQMIDLIKDDSKVKEEGEKRRKQGEWKKELSVDKYGNVKSTVLNMVLILNNDEELQNMGLNTFSGRYETTGQVGWDRRGKSKEWNDGDEAQMFYYMAEKYKVEFKANTFRMGITKIMDERRFDPVKDMVEGLPVWDGQERIDTLFIDYLNAEDNIYNRQVARKMMIALIAKALKPEAQESKYDEMVILQGAGGIGKSTLLKNIVGAEWYSDSFDLKDTDSKEGGQAIQGFWLIECGELSGAAKADVNRLKNFISRMSDDYRPSYGHNVEKHPRRCILCGTTNTECGFLRDITGNRKYWPVVCSKGASKDPRNITEEDRKQFLAEAYVYWAAGELPVLSEDAEVIATEMQREALLQDERQGLVEIYLNTKLPENWDFLTLEQRREFFRDGSRKNTGVITRRHVSPLEIHVECFDKDPSELTRKSTNELREIMARIPGWVECAYNDKAYGHRRGYRRVMKDNGNE